MVDEWIDILAGCSFQFDEDLDPWLEWVFLLWGEHWLPDVIATLEDGVAERDIDDILAEFASQLDRYKMLARISHLELGLRTWQPAEPTPHRPVRPADVTKHPKVTPQVCHRIMRAYLEQVNSLQQVRQMSFVDLPSSQPTPKLQLPEGDFHVICSQ